MATVRQVELRARAKEAANAVAWDFSIEVDGGATVATAPPTPAILLALSDPRPRDMSSTRKLVAELFLEEVPGLDKWDADDASAVVAAYVTAAGEHGRKKAGASARAVAEATKAALAGSGQSTATSGRS